MPYTLPTVDQFKSRFNGNFDCVDPLAIESAIDEAARNVDQTWIESDYQPAIMFLAAHNLVEENVFGDRGTDVTGPLTSQKLGDASESYANAQNMESNSIYGSTVYGRRYQRLLRLNYQGPILL